MAAFVILDHLAVLAHLQGSESGLDLLGPIHLALVLVADQKPLGGDGVKAQDGIVLGIFHHQGGEIRAGFQLAVQVVGGSQGVCHPFGFQGVGFGFQRPVLGKDLRQAGILLAAEGGVKGQLAIFCG